MANRRRRRPNEVDLFLREYGVNINQMKVATLTSPQVYLTAMKTNQIDWFCTSEPTPLQAQAAGAGIVVAGPGNVAAWSPDNIGPGNITITQRSYAAQNANTVKRFTQAMQEAVKYIHDNEGSDAVADIAAGELPNVPHDVLKQAISEIDWPVNGKMTAAQWSAGVKFSSQIGAIEGGTKVSEGADWTNEYLG